MSIVVSESKDVFVLIEKTMGTLRTWKGWRPRRWLARVRPLQGAFVYEASFRGRCRSAKLGQTFGLDES